MMRQEEKQRPIAEWKAWVVWSCAALFYGYQFALRVSPSVMTDDLMSTFAIDACTLGIFMALYYNAYAFLQIPAGSLLDRFGPRKMLAFATLLCILGCVLFASATSTVWIGAGRLFIGAGSAFGFLSCLKIGTTWFVPQRLPLVLGITLCLGTLGATGGGGPLSAMVNGMGWRSTVWWLAGVGVVLLGLIVIFVKSAPPQTSTTPETEEQVPFLASLRVIIIKPQTWFIALYGILMYVPLSAFADMWGVNFLSTVYKIDKTTAAQLVSNLYIGMGVGSPLFPLLCQRLRAYKPSLYLSASVSIVLFLILIMNTDFSVWTLSIILFLLGAFLAGQILCFSIVPEINPKSISATAAGFHNMICMISGVIFQPLIGHILHYSSAMSGNYQASDYILALSPIPIVLLIALIVAFWIQEVYPQKEGVGSSLIPEKI